MSSNRINLSKQPKGLKIATVHELKEIGFTYNQISRRTGIPYGSVKRYAKEDVDREWSGFGKILKKRALEEAGSISELATKRMKETLPEASLRDATGAYKVSQDIISQYTNPNKGEGIIQISESKVLVLPQELIDKRGLSTS